MPCRRRGDACAGPNQIGRRDAMRQSTSRPLASSVGSFALLLSFAVGSFVAVSSTPAAAQILYGSITGNVSDQTGAALASVTVEAANTGTGVVKTATTDDR